MLRGISQKDLADYFGMSPGNLCDWEKGRSEPDIAGLVKLANFFGESIDYLVGRVDDGITMRYEPISRAKQHLIYLIRTLSETDVKALTAMAETLKAGEETDKDAGPDRSAPDTKI